MTGQNDCEKNVVFSFFFARELHSTLRRAEGAAWDMRKVVDELKVLCHSVVVGIGCEMIFLYCTLAVFGAWKIDWIRKEFQLWQMLRVYFCVAFGWASVSAAETVDNKIITAISLKYTRVERRLVILWTECVFCSILFFVVVRWNSPHFGSST